MRLWRDGQRHSGFRTTATFLPQLRPAGFRAAGEHLPGHNPAEKAGAANRCRNGHSHGGLFA
jgi:hypothetical protein